ncbi:aromatic-ring-hydroxylating dioxygenase subunit beta [Haladaptatus sp. DJG-WS-42]|uniref:aromatic-ring-hydroxylating dioxygenase subunit beta n=1 Tax=Haladaptatus sp. DJG-WS-42 TaxID=3120516 RepID=UPI0030CB0067
MVTEPEYSADELAELRRYHQCRRFLYDEAALLDQFELEAWLDCLTEDIDYRVPIRLTRERTAAPFSTDSYHFKDDFSSLQTRVNRVLTEYDWSESPPSRTRRFVTNLRILEHREDEVDVASNLLLFRTREERRHPELISGKRHDTIRFTAEPRLARRTVYLDHTVLGSDRLSILL